jgi:predicted nucleic acid-binding protein
VRLLLDTNVLIDYYAGREPYHRDAYRLRVMHEFGDAELWASIQSFADIAYVLRGTVSSKRLQDAFYESLDFLRVCSLDQNDLLSATAKKWDDFEDCLIEQCAQKVKADYLLSRDTTGFAQAKTTVLTPDEFFTLMQTEQGLTYEFLG